MALVSRRLRWLEVLFPPAEANPPNPNQVSNDIVFTHSVLTGTERMTEVQDLFYTAGAGAVAINSAQVPDNKYWYVMGASMTHNDATPREGYMAYQINGIVTSISHHAVINQNVFVPVGRSFILPARHYLRYQLMALAGGSVLQGHITFLEMDIGEPVPGC